MNTLHTLTTAVLLLSHVFVNGQTKEYTRKAYVCDYCNEYKFKPVDLSTSQKVEEFLCSHYWYSLAPSTSGPATVAAELLFKGDKTVMMMEKDGKTYEGIYSFGSSESYQLNSTQKTNRVKIKVTIYGLTYMPEGQEFNYSVFQNGGEYIYTGDKPNGVAWTVGFDVSKSIIDKAAKAEAEVASSKEAIATYIGGEFVGYCLIHFLTDTGEELHFKNAMNIDYYLAGMGECKFAEKFVGKKFKIHYQIGDVKVYSEDSGETSVIKDFVITSIALVE